MQNEGSKKKDVCQSKVGRFHSWSSLHKRVLKFLIFMGMVVLLVCGVHENLGFIWRRNDVVMSSIRRLSGGRGVGSSPPDCRSKCSSCTPCTSVLVPIHPSRTVTPMDYYPEVWRCKCGDSLYNP